MEKTKNRNRGALPADFPKGPAIILVAPQMGDNIGKAARAMLNCGLTDLRLVNPRDGWPNERAEACCSGAYLVLDQVQLFDSVRDAVGDIDYVLGTTARLRDIDLPVYKPSAAVEQLNTTYSNSQKSAILFGCERSGLDNDDIALCDGVLSIPLNPEFSSLNLAQAVLLIAYQWFSSQEHDLATTPYKTHDEAAPARASKEQLYNLFDHLEDELAKGGYFKTEELRPKIVKNIQAMLSRASLSEQEVRSLLGMIVSLSGRKRDT